MSKRIALDPEMLDAVAGGSVGFNPDGNGTYTMKCQFSGATYTGVTLQQIIEVAQYGAGLTNTAEDEQKLVDWCRTHNIIH